MPTTLPVRTAPPALSIDLIDFARALFLLYSGIVISMSIIVAMQYALGMFEGLTLVESILRATSSGLPFSDPQLVGML
jgi:hypothetical protein